MNKYISASYFAVLSTLVKKLASQKVFLFCLKVQSNALIVLLRRCRSWGSQIKFGPAKPKNVELQSRKTATSRKENNN